MILQYEFLGPVRLSEWGPPMEKVVYLVMSRDEKDRFAIVYAGDCESTGEEDYFTGSDLFKCWLEGCGRRDDRMYLCILPMFGASRGERRRVVDRIVSSYRPACNGSGGEERRP